MAHLLWGNVYFKTTFAGVLSQVPGSRCQFQYDESYLNTDHPSIAYTLPLRKEPHTSENILLPFFDNLVAEGWLEQAQARLLGKRHSNRFELLLAFGADCAGAVSIIDPNPAKLFTDKLDMHDAKNVALLKSRASLSGIQPKLTLVKEKGQFRPAQAGETSTYIAKFPSTTLPDITYNEWLTTCACKALLPEDHVVEMQIDSIEGFSDDALIIKRFDRTEQGERLHFEEFNQLLNLYSEDKYDGAYKDMANFIQTQKNCIPADNFKLFIRILVGILTGNTDMHFKNFAMMHIHNNLELSPAYDQVAAAIYPPYQYMGLAFDSAIDREIGKLKPKNIIALGHEFGFKNDTIMLAIEKIKKNIDAAKDAVNQAAKNNTLMGNNIIRFMEKRWNGIFSLIGKYMLKKQ